MLLFFCLVHYRQLLAWLVYYSVLVVMVFHTWLSAQEAVL